MRMSEEATALADIVRDLRRWVAAAPLRGGGLTRGAFQNEGGSTIPAIRATKAPAEASGADGLDAVRRELGDCRRCPLHATRRNLVFGEGNPAAELVFVGEAPGGDEDREGRPFVGAAGQLLSRIILAMGLERREVYICNVLKCRPPANRTPSPEEIGQCRPFLQRQLEAIRPRVVCTLGAVAAQTLLETSAPLSALRGRFHVLRNRDVMPTYHPAYLLRNEGAKRLVWQDVQLVMKALQGRAGADS